MRAPVSIAAFALFTLLALPACDKPDVGSRCTLSWNDKWKTDPSATPPPTPATAGGDYFESGNTDCDDLICIVSPAASGSKYGSCSGEACGYCSKPCVSDRDCYTSSTDLVCAQLILDPVFIASLDEATRQRYLGEIQFADYCVVRR